MGKSPLTLNEWIERETPMKVSRDLEVPYSTVRHWRVGYSHPKLPIMKRIVEITKGEVTYQSIIEPYLKTTSRFK